MQILSGELSCCKVLFKMHDRDRAHSQKTSFTILLSLSLNIHTHPSYKATKFCLIISTTTILLRRERKEKKGKKEV